MSSKIRVKKLPRNVSRDQLENYFQRGRIFGEGIHVSDVQSDGDEAIVTFTDEAGMNRVLQRHARIPCRLFNSTLDIQPFSASSPKSPSHVGKKAVNEEVYDDDAVEDDETDTVEVKWISTPGLQVQGFGENVSEELLRNYFENPIRAGGGEITGFLLIGDFAQIKFKEKKVVKAVVQKTHSLSGCTLRVKPLIISRKTLLLTNLPPDVSEESLENYMEAKLQVPTSTVTLSQDRTKAMVDFMTDIDFEKAKRVCEQNHFLKAYLNVQPAPVTSSVVVTNVCPDLSGESVSLYFENKNKSHGGMVEDVEMVSKQGYCLVHFRYTSDMMSVCQKGDHSLSGTKLDVKPYHRCLGLPFSTAQTKLTIPSAVEISENDSLKLTVTARQEKRKNTIIAKLTNVHAEIADWKASPLRVVCTLTESAVDFHALVSSWQDTVRLTLQEYTTELEIQKLPVSKEIWKIAKEHLGSLDVRDPERTSLLYEDDVVMLIAPHQEINMIWENIGKEIRNAEQALKRQSEVISEVKYLKKSWEGDFLMAADFINEKENTSEGTIVNVDSDKVTFTGGKSDITKAIVRMYDLLQHVNSNKPNIQRKDMKMLKKHLVKDCLVEKIKQRRVVGVVEICDDTVMIHGKDDGSVNDVKEILNDLLAKFSLPLNKDNLPVFQSSQWHQYKDKVSREYKDCFEIEICKDSMKLEVCTLEDYEHELKSKLKEFLQTNAVLTKTVVLKDKHVARYMNRFCKKQIDNEVDKCRNGPKYSFEGSKIVLKGTEEDLGRLKRFFEEKADGVLSKDYTIKKIGIQKYLICPAGKQCIEHLEKYNQCIVVVNGGDWKGQSREPRASQHGLHSEPSRGGCTEISIGGHVKMHIVRGDLTEQTVDVIAVSAGKNLQFRGRLHTLITDKGGTSIEDDCKSRVGNKGSLREGDVYLGPAGDLPCKAIAHVVVAPWDRGNQDIHILVRVIENCMRKCDKKQFRSIAFPGLGTGQLHYPTDIACKTIINTVIKYIEQTSDTSIKEVVLCDMNPNTLSSFEDCLGQKDGGQHRTESKENYPGRHRRDRDTQRWRDKSPESPITSGGVKIGSVRIQVVAGILAEERVDVIVDSAPRDLHLKKGKCSNALVEAGGYRIQQECKDKFPKGIRPGQVAVTCGGKLNCKNIFHITLQQYNRDEHEEAVQGLKRSIDESLRQAADDGFASIAIPSAGTGSMKFPSHVVSQEMFASVAKFVRKNPRSSLSLVRFVIFPKDKETVKAFQDEEKKVSGQGNDDDVEIVYNRGRSHGDNDDSSVEVKCQGAKIVLVKAHLSKEKSDAIVNSTSQDLSLDKGQSSKAILKAAGQSIQQECQQQHSGGITAGQVAVTSPGNLKCKKIFHIAVPPFEKENDEQSMQNIVASVEQCLAEGDKQGFRTMSIPPIGTGALKYPKGWVAGKTFSCVSKYFKDHTGSSLNTIRLVVFPGDDEVFQAFKKEAFKRTPKPDGDSSRPKRQDRDAMETFLSKEKNVCTLTIFSDQRGKLEEVRKKFEATVEKEWCSKKIEDEAISSLGYGKIKEIKDDFQKHNIFAHINKDSGYIIAYGLAKDLLEASGKLDEVLRKQHKYQSTKNEAMLVKNMTRWSYLVNNKTIPFGDIDNLNIEKSYKNKDKQTQLKNRSGQTFIIDFKNMESYESSKPGTKTAVIRRDIMADASGTLPDHWTKGNSSDNVTLVPLAKGCAEYTKVLNEFSQSLGRTPNIIQIERVQNKTLYIQYVAKLNSIDVQNNNKNNVKVLWHGTSAQIVPSIYTHGFNRSYCNLGCAIGVGVYFAVNASYSDGGYARPDAQGHKRMFRSLVITGQTTQGRSGMRMAPNRTTVGNTPIPYDSVTDNPGGSSMFVIFHDCQAYPEHLITYT